ncbi:MAG: hypothetical protein RL662_827 [Bacteroidota bacterium]|jgi:membrane-anchored protein YejM (alkaline phosphatase superfamily)
MQLEDRFKIAGRFVLGSIFIIFFVFLFSIFNSGIAQMMGFLSWIYYVVAAIGHSTLMATILFIIFNLPFLFLFKNIKISTSIFLFAGMLLQIILILDSFVFDIYKFHFNGFVLELLTGGAADEIFVIDSNIYLKFFGTISIFVIAPYLSLYFVIFRAEKIRKSVCINRLLILGFICLVFSHLGYAVAHAVRDTKIEKSSLVLPWFFPLTANSLFVKLGLITGDEIDSLAYNQSNGDLQYPLNPIEVADSIPNYNIIYLVVDSWNPRVFEPDNMPNTYRFAKEKAQIFTDHISSNYATRGGIFGLFFGIPLSYQKEFCIAKMSPVFIDRLLDLDYHIQIFPSADFTNPPLHELVFRRVPSIQTEADGACSYERDIAITNNYLDFVNRDNQSKPFFSMLFFDELHTMTLSKNYPKKYMPSWDAADYMVLSNDLDPAPFFNFYRNCAVFVDEQIGRVLDAVEKKGLLDNTVIIITGDHGQEFNENKKNYWGHGSNFSKWQTQVPFVVYYPGIQPASVEHMTTHYDVSATLMRRFLGVKNPTSDYSLGYDLWDGEAMRYPHLVGDNINYGFVLEDQILSTGHTGGLKVTDKDLNSLPRDSMRVSDVKKAIDLKNKFYKK